MRFKCPHCEQSVEIDDELAMLETSIECPWCDKDVIIAEQSDAPTPKPRPTGKRAPWKKWKWRSSIARPSGATWIESWIAFAGCTGLTVVFYVSDPRLFKTLSILSFVWLIPIATIIFGAKAARTTYRALRFCGARLRLLTHPGVIGGTFKAELVIRQVLPRGTEIKACLVNQGVNKVHNPNSKGYVTISRVFTSTHDIQIDELSYRNGRYVIPLEYDIPSSAKDESDDICTNTRTTAYRWRLQAKATLVGADMDLDFPVPVYHKKNIE
jgi:endogenous inhibitor of DNA gyrase (YacG/DUF329 family)